MTTSTHFDVIVIGAGAGGLFSAALLAHKGYRTLLVEASDIVGGRASTRIKDGFAINTGALGIELGTEFEAAFRRIGADLNVRQPGIGIVIRLGRRDLNIASGFNGALVRGATHLGRWGTRLFPGMAPRPGESTLAWVQRFSTHPTLLGTVHNFCGSIFAAAPADIPADLFFNYVTTKGAFKKFGFPPGGTLAVWHPLIERFQQMGGTLWLNTTATDISFDDCGCASTVQLRRDGETHTLTTRAVVSDIGPKGTLTLCEGADWPQQYRDRVHQQCQSSAILTAYFASKTPLAAFPGFACFSKTQRLCYAANFTEVCPENAPPGWHLYCGASVPQPATGDFDDAEETRLLLEDLGKAFPGFAQAHLLEVVITRGDWPAQRAVAGRDMAPHTPTANLWNVGDAIKPWGNAATSACAETAMQVADEVDRYLANGAPIAAHQAA
ncbi:FAD-dependent oxidoreductase [Spongiibacter taiwanensis]|uniref:phytoene desaturase family protein n=1 Tax=Spongiibacter taiwanensis TaxID=1748242 RepID=UPI0020365C7A|nr:FAD-dependent oxidoreductase [Spongiibacter taiwanensis]USA42610.1 FAD-dependent oxidoreductase [Spongiibacter taiwanensis]